MTLVLLTTLNRSEGYVSLPPLHRRAPKPRAGVLQDPGSCQAIAPPDHRGVYLVSLYEHCGTTSP
jgi:hypothetical protein